MYNKNKINKNKILNNKINLLVLLLLSLFVAVPFYFILFYFILFLIFYFILFYLKFILFYFILLVLFFFVWSEQNVCRTDNRIYLKNKILTLNDCCFSFVFVLINFAHRRYYILCIYVYDNSNNRLNINMKIVSARPPITLGGLGFCHFYHQISIVGKRNMKYWISL